MKNYYVMTLFPEMIINGLETSITGRAKKNGIINFEAVNIRDFTNDKHGHVDDYPYGGGAGMVMQPQPVYDCYKYIESKIGKKTRVIYLTPQGKVFNQQMAKEMAQEDNLVFLCGHYEGIDERVLEMIVTDYVSIGDYVLTGGELPSMVMIDSISRMVKGVLSNDVSAEEESFSTNLLEYPQYTRPEVFMEKKVPEVLLSGHHANIEKWRKKLSVERTVQRRPDLFLNDGKKDELIEYMLEYYEGDASRILNILKVCLLADYIAKRENIDERTRYILETAAIVRGVGSGKKLDRILLKFNFDEELISRVKLIVEGEHNQSGLDNQILFESDYLVKMQEEDMSDEEIINICSSKFKTGTGKWICEQILHT